MLSRILVFLALLSSWALADSLDGRTVILIMAEHRVGDPKGSQLEDAVKKYRAELGLQADEMPLITMGFADADTKRSYFDGLGVKAQDAPVLAVVEWGNPARFGPKRILSGAVVRNASVHNVPRIINAYLKTMGNPARLTEPDTIPLPNLVEDSEPGRLQIESLRFEVGGKTLFTTNAAARIRNLEKHTLHNISVRFFVRTQGASSWSLLDEQTIKKLLPGYISAREVIKDSRDYDLVDAQLNAKPCQIKIEVEHQGRTIEDEASYLPVGSSPVLSLPPVSPPSSSSDF